MPFMPSPHHDRHTIHLRIRSLDTIFDARDPEPFPEKRLNQNWLEYLLDLISDRPGRSPLHLSLKFVDLQNPEGKPDQWIKGLHHQFLEHNHSLQRKLRENFRFGRVSLFFGLIALVVFMALSVFLSRFRLGVWQHPIDEGLLIIGWVALWHPMDMLFFDWWPIVQERKKIERLLKGSIKIHKKKS